MSTTAHADKMKETRRRFKCFNTHTTELIGYMEAAATNVPVWLHESENVNWASEKQEYRGWLMNCWRGSDHG